MFTRSEMAGFFFCLASGTVQGFYFVLLQYSRTQAFTAAFITSMQLYSKRCKTAHRALQERFRLFTLFCRRCVAGASAYTAPAATRWSVPQRPDALQHIPDTTVTPGRCTGQHRRPIIIRYIRGCSIPQTMLARRGLLPLCAGRWQVLTRCQQYRPGAPAEGSASPPVQSQPGGVSMLPTPGGLQPGTLHPAGHSSGMGAAGGAEPLTASAASLFGLSPGS